MKKVIFNKRTSVNSSCASCNHDGENCKNGEMCPKLQHYFDIGTPEERKFIMDFLEKRKQENNK